MNGSTDVTEHVYKTVGSCDIHVDVHLPKTPVAYPLPILLWFHGGGLLQGSRKSVPPHMLVGVTAQQYCLVSADYRLAPQVSVSDIVDDALDALRFVRKQLSFRLPTSTVYTSDVAVSGSSAGGYLALLLALRDSKLRSCLAIYPITDPVGSFFTTPQSTPDYDRMALSEFLNPRSQVMASTSGDSTRNSMYYHMMASANLADLLHLSEAQGEHAWRYRIAEEIEQHKSKQDICPIYIVHGDADTKVGVEQSRIVHQALDEAEIPNTYEEIPHVDHQFDKDPRHELTPMYEFLSRSWSHPHTGEPAETDTTFTRSDVPSTRSVDITSFTSTNITSSQGEAERALVDPGLDSASETDDSTVSLSSYTSSNDAEEQWAQQMHELSLVLNLIFLPLAGKYFGRQFALWGWAKFISWKTSLNVVRDKGMQRATSAVLAGISS